MPGSFELPLIAKAMAASGKYDAVLALGAVVRPDWHLPAFCSFAFASTCDVVLLPAHARKDVPSKQT